jgi:hypothetical protein
MASPRTHAMAYADAVSFSPSFENYHAATSLSPSFQTSLRQLVNFLPPPVLMALQSDGLNNLAEIRTVTTLFLKLDSFDMCNPSPMSQLQDFFYEMQKCLFECGGVLRQFLVDDKGCVLIALWGVPTASHPANTSRAVCCALMMKSAASALRERISIGIATGSVYCGTIGTSTRYIRTVTNNIYTHYFCFLSLSLSHTHSLSFSGVIMLR